MAWAFWRPEMKMLRSESPAAEELLGTDGSFGVVVSFGTMIAIAVSLR
jgi:hypothetical protein